MRTGIDRSEPGYPGGTRHPCPFCEWYLDAEPLPSEVSVAKGWEYIGPISHRMEMINLWVQEHVRTDHPAEYRSADRLDRIG